MTTFTFNCENEDCRQPITALLSQGGLRMSCRACGTDNPIPRVTVAAPASAPPVREVAHEPAPVPPPTRKTAADQLRSAGRGYLADQMGPLGGLIREKEDPREGAGEEPPERPKKPSLIDRLYTATGRAIDRWVGGDDESATGGVKAALRSARRTYLSFSPYRRRHLAFFISLLLVGLTVALLTASLSIGIKGGILYAAFVALNQLSFLNRMFTVVTEIIVAVTVFFLPEALKNLFSSFLKYLVFLVIVYALGIYLGPLYILYKAALVALDRQEV